MSSSITPLVDEDGIPIVPVTIVRHRKGNLLHVASCPYCGRPHVHGGGRGDQDPRDFQGHRVSHCRMPGVRSRGYVLRIVAEQTPERPP